MGKRKSAKDRKLENEVGDLADKSSDVDLAQLIKWYDEFAWTTIIERELAEKSRDYYDGAQWTAEERRILEERGQPASVINRIAPKVDTISGYEIRGRSDPRAFPTTEAEEDSADAATDAVRFCADDAEVARVFSDGLEGLVVEGKCGAMLSVESEEMEGRDGEMRTEYRANVEFIPQDRMIWDQHARKKNYSDNKFRGYTTWWDVADAAEEWPDYIDMFDDAALNGTSQGTTMGANKDRPQNWYNFERRRVRINHMFWWERNEKTGLKEWFHALYCVTGFLPAPGSDDSEEAGPRIVPFVNDRGRTWCPLKLARAFVTRKNQAYGEVARLISPQDSINHRESKLLNMLAVPNIIMEKGAVENINEFRTQRAIPGGVSEVNPGAITKGQFHEDKNLDTAQSHLALLQDSKQEIDRVGPSLPAIAGDGPAGMSGVAMMRRQTLGSIELEPIFEPFREWKREIYEGLWYLVRQYWDYEMWLRVQDDEAATGFRFVGLNRRMTRAERVQELMKHGMQPQAAFASVDLEPHEIAQIIQDATQKVQQAMATIGQAMQQSGQRLPPEAQQQLQQMQQAQIQAEILAHPMMQKICVANNIGQLRMDIKIDEVPDVTVQQQEQFEIIADMAGKGVFNPQITPPWVAKTLIQMSQLRDKRKFVKLFDQAQQVDPQMQQMQQASAQLKVKQQAVDVENTQADTQKKLADAQVAPAKAAGETAYAMHTALHAGKASVPKPPDMPAMAAGSERKMLP